MNPVVKHYLDQFRASLQGIPEAERADIVREIESHIAEAVDGGRSLADVLERLGPADRLARAYTADAILSGPGRPWRKLLTAAGVLTASSLASLFVIPFLGLIGFVMPIAGVMAFVFNLVMVIIHPGTQLPLTELGNLPSAVETPLGLLLNLVMAALGLGALALLRKYIRFMIKTVRSSLD